MLKSKSTWGLYFTLFLSLGCDKQVEFRELSSGILRNGGFEYTDDDQPEAPGPAQPPVVVTPPPVVVTPPPVVVTPPPVVVAPPPSEEPAGNEQQEVFYQTTVSNSVDIVIVEDTTLSMHGDRWTLHQKFSQAFENMSGLDWRLAITSTDLGSNRLDGRFIEFDYRGTSFLTPNTSNFKQKFMDKIGFLHCNDDMFSSGWGNIGCTLNSERMLEATIKTINRNSNFYRQDANLAVVYITDEDETVPVRDHLTTPSEVFEAITQRFGDEKNFTAYGAIIQPSDSDCLLKQTGPFTSPGAKYGVAINELVEMTGGSTVSICSNDYSGLFADIKGKNKGVLKKEFRLKEFYPIDIEVLFEPSQNISYKVEQRSEIVDNKEQKYKVLVFDSEPLSGTKITINYKYH